MVSTDKTGDKPRMTQQEIKTRAERQFNELVEIYNTTGKCFTYWKDHMTVEERKALAWYYCKNFSWAAVLNVVQEAAERMKKYN